MRTKPTPNATLAGELGQPSEERPTDPAALVALGNIDLVDEELRPVAVPPRQLVRENEADRALLVKGDES